MLAKSHHLSINSVTLWSLEYLIYPVHMSNWYNVFVKAKMMSSRRSPKRTTNGRSKVKPAVQPRILLLSDVKKEYMLVNMSLRLAQNGCKQITGMSRVLSTFNALLSIVKHRSFILLCDRDRDTL